MPEVDKLIDKMAVDPSEDGRASAGGQIDKLIMDAAEIYPGIDAKTVLLRGKGLKNVFINDAYGGQYDYTALGVK